MQNRKYVKRFKITYDSCLNIVSLMRDMLYWKQENGGIPEEGGYDEERKNEK